MSTAEDILRLLKEIEQTATEMTQLVAGIGYPIAATHYSRSIAVRLAKVQELLNRKATS